MFHLRSHCCQFLVKNGWPGSITRRASLYLDRNWWTPNFGRLLSEGISMGFNIKKGEKECCRRVRRCEVRISWPNLFREPGDRPFSSPYWIPPPPTTPQNILNSSRKHSPQRRRCETSQVFRFRNHSRIILVKNKSLGGHHKTCVRVP